MNAIALMEATWGAEWLELSAQHKARVAKDFEDAAREDGCDTREYVRRIGRGNLASYATCLRRAA